MTESIRTVSPVVLLKGSNYPTWKLQCRMVLMKAGLWSIVNGTENAPGTDADPDVIAKYTARRDSALAHIVLSVDPTLLYLLGDPEDPVIVWKKLSDQFQKKSWANKLQLRRRLYSLRLRDGESVQEHIRKLTELFEELAVIGDPMKEEDQVVHLLASLPDSFNVLVTALESNADVPKMEVVTERLLHEERKQQDKRSSSPSKALSVSRQKKGPRCFHCGKPGHFRRDCRQLKAENEKSKLHKGNKSGKNQASIGQHSRCESDVLVVEQALQAGAAENWIVDSGATCHMCHDKKLFSELQLLEKPTEVTLGDGHTLKGIGHGTVTVTMNQHDGSTSECRLLNVLYVPSLSYNLLSVSKAAENGKTTEFDKEGCKLLSPSGRIIARAHRLGSLYYLDCRVINRANVSQNKSDQIVLWHRRFGHLSKRGLQTLAREGMVHGLNSSLSDELDFCESCVNGKLKRASFEVRSCRSTFPLGIVHSDLCGKMNSPSLGGAEYFLTFIDDCTHYTWVYVLKRKSEVFNRFQKWKALVENESGKKLKVLRTDGGGEYTSTEFQDFLDSAGIRHEQTVPKTPEQNGVAERMNRTLVESVRSMLADAHLPHEFWAEAVSTAVYLRNRSPTKAVSGKTPYEAWMAKRPSVSHLRVFGCKAYAHVPKDERGKLDHKAKPCVLVGYGAETKGYRLYDINKRKVLFSRDVSFNENETGIGRDLVSSEGDQYLDLDLSDEDLFNTDNPDSEAECQGENQTDVEEESITDQSNEVPAPAVPRRSERVRQHPDYYGTWVNTIKEQGAEPATVDEAMSSPERKKWKEAMRKEMKSIETNKVWELVELPKGKKTIGCKWVYKRKTDADGSLKRYKARLVAKGYSQQHGLDYDETFSPVARFESLRTLLALAVQDGLRVHHMDVTTAFLNGELKEEVYMDQPEEFQVQGKENQVCKLNRSLYGLKQAPRCWNVTLDGRLKEMGFAQTTSDPCLYIAKDGEPFLIGIYVDDILLAGRSEKRLAKVKSDLSEKFDVKDLGELNHFLGVKIVQNHSAGTIWIGQPTYTEEVLKKFGMENCKPVATPAEAGQKLTKGTEDSEYVDKVHYQSVVGSLLYLSTRTRPDITFAVNRVARFCSNPTTQHMTAVKRILRYLRGTTTLGLLYKRNGSKAIVGFSDSDWGGDVDDRKSTSGYVFQIGGSTVSWRSKKQTSVALSTAEAEYISLSATTQEAVWIRQLCAELSATPPTDPTVIFEDNQSTIAMSRSPQFHGRSKHIGIKYHFVRDQVTEGTIKLKYCPTTEMVADMLTKGLPKDQFMKLREMIGLDKCSDSE